MDVYAYICAACDHPLTRHVLGPTAQDRDGPYFCDVVDCTCEYYDHHPFIEVDRSTYDSNFAEIEIIDPAE